MHRRPREAGVALLLAVWILALLAVIAGELIASGRVRYFTELNRRDDLSGLALALAGYQDALAALEQVTALSRTDDKLLLHFRGAAEGESAFRDDVPLGDGKYSWRVEDENGRVNVNDRALNSSRLDKLLGKCGFDPGATRDSIVASILDWRDPSTGHQLNGAGEEYYQDLDPPYSCKDGDFDVLEELLLVKGMNDPENQWVFNGREKDGEKLPGLRDLLTTFGPRISDMNRATAPDAVLEALGMQRVPNPRDSQNFSIVATGYPGGDAEPRSLRAVVRRYPGRKPPFTLLYWNETYTPE